MLLNTGTPRSIKGHAVSGGLVAFMLAGANNYRKFQKGQISKENAIKNTTKATLQGALLTATAVGAANALGGKNTFLGNQNISKNLLESLAFVALGGVASYGIECIFNTEESEKDSKFSIESQDSTEESPLLLADSTQQN